MKSYADLFRDQVKQLIADQTAYLRSGGPATLEEYRETVGRLKGLELALELFNAIEARQLRDEEEVTA